jgi:hypothetical protein
MTFPETLNTKVADNELSLPLVTYMAYSDARFENYGILKSGRGAESFLDGLCRPANDQVLRAKNARNLMRVIYKFRRPLTQLSNAYSPAHFGNHSSGYSCFNTATCGVQRIAVKQNRKRFRLGLILDNGEIPTFNLLLSFFVQVT